MNSRTFRIFTVGQAALLFTGACFLLTVPCFLFLVPESARLGPFPSTPTFGEIVTLVVFFVVPAALGAWWIFRRLRDDYLQRQALSAAIVFAVFSPVPLIVGLGVGPIVGGYSGIVLGTDSRLVAFSSAVLGVAVVIALMTFIPSLLALWITRGSGHRKSHSA